MKIAQNICDNCASKSWEIDDYLIGRTISIGVSMKDFSSCQKDKFQLRCNKDKVNKMIRQADQHLYEAKKRGKNRVVSELNRK